jgi:hypothetical protein
MRSLESNSRDEGILEVRKIVGDSTAPKAFSKRPNNVAKCQWANHHAVHAGDDAILNEISIWYPAPAYCIMMNTPFGGNLTMFKLSCM